VAQIRGMFGTRIAELPVVYRGPLACFALNAASYVAVLVGLLAMRGIAPRPRKGHMSVSRGLVEGLKYAFGFPPIRSILALMAFVSLMGMPLMVLQPVFAKTVLNGGPRLLGFLHGATGLGALASAVYLASRQSVLGLGRRMLIATGVLGAGMIAYSLSRNVPLSLGLLVVAGFCLIFQMASCNTLLQTIAEPDKQGRVMSLYAMAFMGMTPLGSLWSGKAAQWFSAPLALQVGGTACLCGAIAFSRMLPRLREQVRPIYERAGILPQMAAALETTAELQAAPEETG
jgi:hypothetical protein